MNSADDCSNNDLYYKAVTQMHKNDPSYRSAYGLYKLNAARGKVADACMYLEEAIDYDESDDAIDAQYLYELARFAYANNMRGRAFDAASKAVRLDNGYAGKAYMIMGNLWSSASCSGDVNKYARYWAAADYYQKAMNADSSLADDARSAIGKVSVYYPEASEIFMYDLANRIGGCFRRIFVQGQPLRSRETGPVRNAAPGSGQHVLHPDGKRPAEDARGGPRDGGL